MRSARWGVLLVPLLIAALGASGEVLIARAPISSVPHDVASFPSTQLTFLHTFGEELEGPRGGLVQGADGNLYGTTSDAVFRMTPAGDVTVLHVFDSATEGTSPSALVQGNDGNFYGTTSFGGPQFNGSASEMGTAFRMTPTGVVTVLHAFTGEADGSQPHALIQATDGNFYGTASYSGAHEAGTAFKMTPAGVITGLHAFIRETEGASPDAALVQAVDGNFYGTTSAGGVLREGTIFKMTPTGVVTVLHAFDWATEGSDPGGLIQATDGNLYGTTSVGAGVQDNGTAFKITPNGAFTVLHVFGNSSAFEGSCGALAQASDGNFYGTTSGSFPGEDTAFRMTPTGTFTVLHVFRGGADGAGPGGPLLLARDGNLYGTTGGGGLPNAGTAYRMTPTGSVTVLQSFGGRTAGRSPSALIQATDGNFYGTTSFGGPFNGGAAFAMTPTGAVRILHAFNRAVEGYDASGLIQGIDGDFYGTTAGGDGPASDGTAFRITRTGTCTVLHSFSAATDGRSPNGLIQASNGDLYGTADSGGDRAHGTAFKITPTGIFTVLHVFGGGAADGAEPNGKLIEARDGSFYGTTSSGGTGSGTVYRMTPTGDVAVLHALNGGTDGRRPVKAVVEGADGSLYGTTRAVYIRPMGGIRLVLPSRAFKVTPGGVFTVVHTFTPTEGDSSSTLIRASDGNFYGATSGSLVAGTPGVVFGMTPDGDVSTLSALTTANSLYQAADGNLYGTSGAAFRLSLPANGPTDVRMALDTPGSGATFSVGQSFSIAGWAVDQGAALGTGVDAVHVYAFPSAGGVFGAPVFLGAATLRGSRADVGTALGGQFANSGYSLAVTGLNAGAYRIAVYAHSAVAATLSGFAFADVRVGTSRPFMSLDGPVNNSTIRQPFNTGGWAVDLGTAIGTGVDAIHVWAFPIVNGVVGEGRFAAAALLGGARPDVAAAFGSQFANAGFNFLMTGLPPGQYYVGVYVHSSVTGTFNQQQFALITIVP